MNLKIEDMQLFPMGLAIKWSDNTDSLLPYEKLRTLCPCAHCSGESDVFGNVYKGPPLKMTAQSYQLKGLQPVGYYGLRPFWADSHTTGIYTIELLKELATAE